MVKVTINSKPVGDSTLEALTAPFPSLLGTTCNAPLEFYNRFLRAAGNHDHQLVTKYSEDLNTTLVFAGLLSAVTSAFIIDAQSNLQPDFNELNYELLKIVANATLGGDTSDRFLPDWEGPDPVVVRIMVMLYSSLLASLLAATTAMFGRQWLGHYALVEGRSIVDCGRQRRRKMDGMIAWQFSHIMGSPALILQAAVLLLGLALSNYLFFINRAVASVIIGFTAFGVTYFLTLAAVSTLSHNCPYQTTFSLILHSLIGFGGKYGGYLRRFMKGWFGCTSLEGREQLGPGSGAPFDLGRFGTSDGNNFDDHIEVPMTGPPNQPLPIFNKEIDWDGYVLDSNCVAWMFELPAGIDTTIAIAGFVPEIVWHAGIPFAPLERLYNMAHDCFDYSSGYPKLKPAFRDCAYLTAKALLHVGIQRKCIADETESHVFASIMNQHQIMCSEHYKGDSDLTSTLGIIDYIFGNDNPMSWESFSFTIPHHAWMGHILLYCAWDALRKGGPLPDDVRGFILHTFQLNPLPPTPIIADCLFMVGLVLGINLHTDDLPVIDKSNEVNPQIGRIYDKLTVVFRNPMATTNEIDCALEAMGFITCLSMNDIALKSYHLFHVIMQTPAPLAYSEGKKWKASHLAMCGAYKYGMPMPPVGDPQDILTFLGHHFGQNQYELVQSALYALAYASGPTTLEALEHFDPTEPSFINGICHVFQDSCPLQLRKAALSFLPLISNKWFETPHPIMGSDQMRSLCMGWASTVDCIGHTHDVQEAALVVFLGMINSSHWRPHINTEKWELLKYFTSVPDNSQPLRMCIDNLELMDVIMNMKDPATITLWLTIMWYKHKELSPQVQERLEVVTEVAQDNRIDINMCLSTIDSELEKAKETLTQFGMQSTNPAANLLKTKITNLEAAKTSIVALSRG